MKNPFPLPQIRKKHEEACDSRHCYNRADIYHDNGEKYCADCEPDQHTPDLLKAFAALKSVGIIK